MWRVLYIQGSLAQGRRVFSAIRRTSQVLPRSIRDPPTRDNECPLSPSQGHARNFGCTLRNDHSRSRLLHLPMSRVQRHVWNDRSTCARVHMHASLNQWPVLFLQRTASSVHRWVLSVHRRMLSYRRFTVVFLQQLLSRDGHAPDDQRRVLAQLLRRPALTTAAFQSDPLYATATHRSVASVTIWTDETFAPPLKTVS